MGFLCARGGYVHLMVCGMIVTWFARSVFMYFHHNIRRVGGDVRASYLLKRDNQYGRGILTM